MAPCRRLPDRDARRARPRPRGRGRRAARRRPAGDRGRARLGQAAAPARAHLGRAPGARDRHARRLLDDLDGPRHPGRRDASSRSRPSPRNAEIARANLDRAGVGREGRDPHRARRRRAADPRGRRRRSTSSSSTPTRSRTRSTSTGRRGSGRPGTVVVVDNIGRGGRGRQPRDRRTRRSSARSAASRCSAATPASTRPRCRRSISRAGTASRSPSSCDATRDARPRRLWPRHPPH